MSNVQRFNTMPLPGSDTVTITRPSDDGMFVLHCDHLAAMQAKDEEIAALRARLENAMEWEVMTDAAVFDHQEQLLGFKYGGKHGGGVRLVWARNVQGDAKEFFQEYRDGLSRNQLSHFARIKEPK